MKNYYVLFQNHHNGMQLYQALKQKGIRTVIVPTPRKLSSCCGISLQIKEEQRDEVLDCVKREGIPIEKIEALVVEHDASRDRYC